MPQDGVVRAEGLLRFPALQLRLLAGGPGVSRRAAWAHVSELEDLRRHGPEQLAAVAAELNDRPRMTLGWDTPAARLAASLAQDPHSSRLRQQPGCQRCEDGLMAGLRRTRPGTTARAATDPAQAGLAKETLRELAPLLAGEGIDAGNIDVPGRDTLQAALSRAAERHNMTASPPPVTPATWPSPHCGR